MKNIVVLLVLVLGATKVSAQFFNPFMPNISPQMVLSMSPAQLEMMQNQHLAQIRAQTNALYMQNMQMMQARTAAAYNNMMNSYNNMMNFQYTPTVPPTPTPIPTTGDTHEKVTCSSCGGSGRVTRNKAVYGVNARMVTVKEICSECHGKGYNRE